MNIEDLYDNIIDRLKELKSSYNEEKVQKLSLLLSKIVALKSKIEHIENQKKELEKDYIALSSDSQIVDLSEYVVDPLITSTRELGKKKRFEFIENLDKKGIILKQKKGVLYENPKDSSLVGIAYSGEKYKSWFLGLPINKYKTIVLLCSRESEKMLNIILPEDFCYNYLDHLSTSHGQYKFSVRMKNKEIYIYTRKGSVPITQFVNNYKPFLL